FAALLELKICILLDVGTNLHKPQYITCEKIRLLIKENLLNPLIVSQNFKYKISNILDKPSESVFGYILVLPDAFSTY
ncbi:13643_t:CDS:2, partial [Dentiscutata heterogama]